MVTETVVNRRSVPPGDLPVGHVYIDRGSIYGNPFSHLPVSKSTALVQLGSREEAIECYRRWLKTGGLPDGVYDDVRAMLARRRRVIWENLEALRGQVLVCWCKPKACHGDVLVDLLQANGQVAS